MDSESPADRNRGKTLAVGFGTAVSMWAVCYVALIRPGQSVGEALFGVTLLCLALGGAISGRHAAPGEVGWFAGFKVGVVAALLNLLMVGSLLVDPATHGLQPNALLWVAGNLLVSAILGLIGGAIGSALRPVERPIDWFNRFTIVAAVTVFLLLITGGLVTGLRAGLAVPDWPNSFGHNMLLYPLSEMSGGKFFEHTHRLYGMLVGVTAITVAVGMFVFEKRGWLRALAVAYLIMVGLQGWMGGTRVTETSITLAIVHGVFGQIVFTAICCLAVFTSPMWKSDRRPEIRATAATDRTYSMVLPIVLLIQLILGALYRHLRREHNAPPFPVHLLYTHIVFAALVTMLIIFVGGRAWGKYRDVPVLPKLGHGVMKLVGLQLLLGTIATMLVWSRKNEEPIPVLEVVITSAHQITGALLLATSTMLALWTRRLVADSPGPQDHSLAESRSV